MWVVTVGPTDGRASVSADAKDLSSHVTPSLRRGGQHMGERAFEVKASHECISNCAEVESPSISMDRLRRLSRASVRLATQVGRLVGKPDTPFTLLPQAFLSMLTNV